MKQGPQRRKTQSPLSQINIVYVTSSLQSLFQVEKQSLEGFYVLRLKLQYVLVFYTELTAKLEHKCSCEIAEIRVKELRETNFEDKKYVRLPIDLKHCTNNIFNFQYQMKSSLWIRIIKTNFLTVQYKYTFDVKRQ